MRLNKEIPEAILSSTQVSLPILSLGGNAYIVTASDRTRNHWCPRVTDAPLGVQVQKFFKTLTKLQRFSISSRVLRYQYWAKSIQDHLCPKATRLWDSPNAIFPDRSVKVNFKPSFRAVQAQADRDRKAGMARVGIIPPPCSYALIPLCSKSTFQFQILLISKNIILRPYECKSATKRTLLALHPGSSLIHRNCVIRFKGHKTICPCDYKNPAVSYESRTQHSVREGNLLNFLQLTTCLNSCLFPMAPTSGSKEQIPVFRLFCITTPRSLKVEHLSVIGYTVGTGNAASGTTADLDAHCPSVSNIGRLNT